MILISVLLKRIKKLSIKSKNVGMFTSQDPKRLDPTRPISNKLQTLNLCPAVSDRYAPACCLLLKDCNWKYILILKK